MMKQLPFKIGVSILSFVCFLMIFSGMMNKGSTDMTTDMAERAYPVLSFYSGDEQYNPTFGYAERRNAALHKENITPLGENRSLAFHILPKDADLVEEIYLEVRTRDGSRLIEDTEVKDYIKEQDGIDVYTSLKDLLVYGEEYSLTIRLKYDGEDIFYPTRVVQMEEVDAQTFLSFTKNFTDRTFGDKNEYKELKKYLESNSSGDNTDFGHVNIHSSLEQVAWGTLAAKREGEFYDVLLTAEKNTATLKQYCLVQIGEGKEAEHYRVEEYFRVRKGTDRMHLLDYERSMSRLVFEEDDIFFGDTLYLGIDDGNMEYMESPEGGKTAFTKDGVLYMADPGGNRFARVYSYYDKDDYARYPLTKLPRIKILSLDEEGTAIFAVYGYISRGIHEGETGLLVYTFDLSRNTLEEMVFVPYEGSEEMLFANLDHLLYMNGEGKLFFFLDGGIYEVTPASADKELIAGNLSPDSFCVSDTMTLAAWIKEGDESGASVIEIENFDTMHHTDIEADSGKLLMIKGFMGQDLIYGIAYREDVSKDAYGNLFFPMYSVRIQTEDGTVHKNYEQDSVYVTDCVVEDNLLTLYRATKSEAGVFTAIENDTIVDNTPAPESKVRLDEVLTENYETVYQMVLKGEFDTKVLQIMRPKFTLFEEDRRIGIAFSEVEDYYFTYTKGGITGVYSNAADAVRKAYEENGFVLNGRSDYVWEKKELLAKNQIMAIKETGIPEGSSSLAAALESMMQFEGFSQDADAPLESGMSPGEIIEKYMTDRSALNLTGCPIDVVYYYLNQDIPVLAITGDDRGILLTGFNSGEIVWMDPAQGVLRKVSKEESRRTFEEGNNRFITYIKSIE